MAIKTTALLAPSKIEYISLAVAKSRFQVQVDKHPLPGQRPHKAQNKAGRKHLKEKVQPPSCIIQCIEFAGKGKNKFPKQFLADGYHRLDLWFDPKSGVPCPFSELLLVKHIIQVDSLEDGMRKIDELVRAIDSKPAAKQNAERWVAAVAEAGVEAVSKAYVHGTNANSYLKRVLGNPDDAMPDIIVRAEAKVEAHRAMDTLYAFCEQNLPTKLRTRFFHPGVATAVFYRLDAMSNPMMLVGPLQDAILAAARKSEIQLSKSAQLLADKLEELATPWVDKELRARGNREDFYDAVVDELEGTLKSMRPARSAAAYAVAV